VERGSLNGVLGIKVAQERIFMQIALIIFNFGKKKDEPKKKSN